MFEDSLTKVQDNQNSHVDNYNKTIKDEKNQID